MGAALRSDLVAADRPARRLVDYKAGVLAGEPADHVGETSATIIRHRLTVGTSDNHVPARSPVEICLGKAHAVSKHPPAQEVKRHGC